MAHSYTYLLFKMKLVQPSENTILDWIDVNAVYKFKCKKGHVFESTFNGLKYRNGWCKRCRDAEKNKKN